MAKKNTTSDMPQLTDAKIKNKSERDLLDSWHPIIENAMKSLHSKFQADTKFILTESDLKCWLFYYLQQEKPYTPFAVNTEVTHYANHKIQDKETQEDKTEKKYKFRDLTILNPNNVKDAEEIWDENIDDFVNSKGFKHNGPAIHFELKMIRQSQIGNQVAGLKLDIAKLNTYKPYGNDHIRDFVIVCGSRSVGTTLQQFKTAVESKINEITNENVKARLRLYLFDTGKMVYGRWILDKIVFKHFALD